MFPLFVDLSCGGAARKRCVVVGGGAVASRKVKTLLAFGAQVRVIDPVPSPTLKALLPEDALTLRHYAGPGDLAGAFLVLAATNTPRLNRQVAQDAQNLGILVNVADDPGECTFFFPGLVRRGDVTIGISTAGACPRLAVRLKEAINRLLPPGLGETLAHTLKPERHRLKNTGATPQEIRRRLDELITAALEGSPTPPTTQKERSNA